MEYDANLPKYYNANHRFLWERMDKNTLNKSKLFEKIEIGWFTPHQMRRRRKEFREFYRVIVDQILEQMPDIKRFLNIRKRRTMKRLSRNYRKTIKRRF
jgi:hypothetical protein